MKQLKIIIMLFLLLAVSGCKNKKPVSTVQESLPDKEIYTCSMHPQIIRDYPGDCPICGMKLIKKVTTGVKVAEVTLDALLKPTNEFVLTSIPVITIQKKEEAIEIEALGNIAYDTKEVGNVSSSVDGRIEKLYVRYRFQKINIGQHIMDIYSPELLTAQENLLFILKNDASNISLIQAAKDKLLLLGISNHQLQQVIKNNKPAFTVAVYSKYAGHIHEASAGGPMNTTSTGMKDIALLTEELALKEGMYVQKGQSFFTIYNPAKAWVLLNIYGDNQEFVKLGNRVNIVPETTPDKGFSGVIHFIEPFYRKDSKTLTVRVYFNNNSLKIPIGGQVSATIFGNTKDAYWLPKEAVLSLGMDKVVFKKSGGGFKAQKVNTGMLHNNLLQIISGLSAADSVVVNAQYLMDSESFIKVKN
ncbi:efflux RND transporter periplasmic adaptor subunit [Ferruginibacter sp.]|uniref:efflux RND transporter periplasmic adaptor subunit n=1 Tax=Ferruginibacter sp. TaxID=1940288 RepID=UPI00265A9C4D|nr:efflux RND transporter periplasmic adaptor subunit [Ferruginibacter sp.]